MIIENLNICDLSKMVWMQLLTRALVVMCTFFLVNFIKLTKTVTKLHMEGVVSQNKLFAEHRITTTDCWAIYCRTKDFTQFIEL
jgi:hypothetical protein